MGVYDNIMGHLRCPYCRFINEIDDQHKLGYHPCFSTNIIGEHVGIPDGIYDNDPYSPFVFTCKQCGERIHYQIEVSDGILTAITVRTIPDKETQRRILEYLEKAWDLRNKTLYPEIYDRKSLLTKELTDLEAVLKEDLPQTPEPEFRVEDFKIRG